MTTETLQDQTIPPVQHEGNHVLSASRLYLTITIPIILTLISVRLVMTPFFIEFEYNRAGFPEDRYGFTQEERLTYAPYALEYLFNDAGIEYLGDLTFEDGSPLYNERELKHMVDVKVVTQWAFAILGMMIALFTSIIILLALRPATRYWLREGLFGGSLLTLGIIGAIVGVAIVAWDTFFTAFHDLFFASGTWRFAYSDTLIRLFPEQFWFDAALTVGALTTIAACLILFFTWRWANRAPIQVKT
jgi:integral membrane protein (TIGR01906 family)